MTERKDEPRLRQDRPKATSDDTPEVAPAAAPEQTALTPEQTADYRIRGGGRPGDSQNDPQPRDPNTTPKG